MTYSRLGLLTKTTIWTIETNDAMADVRYFLTMVEKYNGWPKKVIPYTAQDTYTAVLLSLIHI